MLVALTVALQLGECTWEHWAVRLISMGLAQMLKGQYGMYGMDRGLASLGSRPGAREYIGSAVGVWELPQGSADFVLDSQGRQRAGFGWG